MDYNTARAIATVGMWLPASISAIFSPEAAAATAGLAMIATIIIWAE